MSAPLNNHTDQQLSNDPTKTILTHTDDRKTRDDLYNNDISKIGTSIRPKVEILRANSPTFKRLVAVRIKLDRHLTSTSKTISPSQPLMPEISKNEKQSTTDVRILSSSQQQPIKSKTKPNTAPLDKITYEKTLSHNGNVKQKCSLEIWLPKADSDDEDGNTNQPPSPDPQIMGNKSISSQSMSIKSRRSSTVKLPGTTTATSDAKSLDETSSKKSEHTLIPRVYRYEDYVVDQLEEQSRSSKSSKANQVNSNGSNKNDKRQRARPDVRHQSPSTNHSDETVQSITSALPMSSTNLLANIKQTYSGQETKGTVGSNSSVMINELMRKYSMIKKSHQELTQAKLQLEKPHQDSKSSPHITKDHSIPSSHGADSTFFTSLDQPIISVKKLSSDTLPPQLTVDYSNTKLIDRRSASRKPYYVDIYPQARFFSVVNPVQQRQTSAAMSNAILPVVVGKKSEDPSRSFQRSKTLDVVFAIPVDTTTKIPSRLPARADSPPNLSNSSNILPRTTNRNEQTPPRIVKRSLVPPLHTLRSEQQPQTSQSLVQLVQYQNIQNSAQRYHHSLHPSTTTKTTDVANNKVLVHLKYSNSGNLDHNCLIPD